MAACSQESCTVAETGVCLLNHKPPDICPNWIKDGTAEAVAGLADPPLSEPARNPQFALGLALGADEVSVLTANRYCRLIGILGIPNSGKTAILVSMYLLLARGKLAGYEFADSQSLMAFDEISRGARRWNDGNTPDQLTVHTELTDERTTGLLHLALKQISSGEVFDLLLPDLPGEWSNALVDSDRSDRLQFIGRADTIWVLVDGDQLVTPETRQWAIHRTKLLLQRVSMIASPCPPVCLVISRRDKVEISEQTIAALEGEAKLRGISMTICPVASFAEPGQVEPGFGIAELVARSVASSQLAPAMWPDAQPATDSRYMMRFGKAGAHG